MGVPQGSHDCKSLSSQGGVRSPRAALILPSTGRETTQQPGQVTMGTQASIPVWASPLPDPPTTHPWQAHQQGC